MRRQIQLSRIRVAFTPPASASAAALKLVNRELKLHGAGEPEADLN